ncbi:hypothetical protein JW756_06780 [Candidatus Woesearchaeota archaeon]|nr:hypothetical protein [Candidatus Woesearchaeota archaeon]
MKLGQGAFEYVLVVGIAMLIIVPGAILFYNYSTKSEDQVARSQIELVGNDIIETVEKVYYIGENSWETLKINIPDNVRWVYILQNSELVIEYDSQSGISEAVFFTDNINITTPYSIAGKEYISDVSADGEMHKGVRLIKVTSLGNRVLINETR